MSLKVKDGFLFGLGFLAASTLINFLGAVLNFIFSVLSSHGGGGGTI